MLRNGLKIYRAYYGMKSDIRDYLQLEIMRDEN